MNPDRPALLSAVRLREDFDRAFAEPPPPPQEGRVRLLAIDLGGRPFALRLDELAGLSAGQAVQPPATRRPGYLGLAALRGSLLPVWDLASLLGLPAAGAAPRWTAVAAGEPAWAAAFGRFDGTLSVARDELLPFRGAGAEAGHAAQAWTGGGAPRPVLSLASLLDTIKGRIAP